MLYINQKLPQITLSFWCRVVLMIKSDRLTAIMANYNSNYKYSATPCLSCSPLEWKKWEATNK